RAPGARRAPPARAGPKRRAGSSPGRHPRRPAPARSLSGALRSRYGKPVRVDDLACYGLAHPNVACDASILRVGGSVGKMLLALHVAAHAEACALDQAEIAAVLGVGPSLARTAP